MNEISAKKLGFTACINALGHDHYEKYKDHCVFASGDEGDKGLWCFVGMNTRDTAREGLHLDASMDDWEYYASCYVKDMKVTMDKCRLPE